MVIRSISLSHIDISAISAFDIGANCQEMTSLNVAARASDLRGLYFTLGSRNNQSNITTLYIRA